MAAPQKPWERAGVNQQNAGNIPVNSMSSSPLTPAVGGVPPCCQPSAGGTGPPPPVPSRATPQTSTAFSRFSSPYGYSSPYSSYSSYGMYGGGYSPYSPYSSGMYGSYGQYGANTGEYNSFARQAEENSRQAFQSVESIVNAFTSVSMMLDSTFQAVFNSFRAVIGVADNFSRLKQQLSSVFSAFALFKFLRYLYRKVMVLLRLRPDMETDEVWSQAAAAAIPAGDGDVPKKSTWPIMMFFAIIMGGPYLIWRLISSVSQTPDKRWMTGEDDHFVFKVLYDYKADNQDELSISAGQEIRVAPKELQPRIKGWLLASVDGQKTGLVPGNYVQKLGKRQGTNRLNQPIVGAPSNSATISSGSSQEQESSGTEKKSCCSKDKSITSSGGQELDGIFKENQQTDTSQVLDNVFNQTSEMDAGDIVEQCQ